MEQAHNSAILEQPLSAPDQATFDRVWNRVMARPGQEPEQSAVPMSAQPSAPVTPPVPAPRPQTAAPSARAEATQYDVPCLGAASLQYIPLLTQLLHASHDLWNSYRTLARQGQSTAARQLRALADGQQKATQQLGAVYFLIAGERFVLTGPVSPPTGPLSHALREMFVREQHWQQIYLQAEAQVHDTCLALLFGELAEQAGLHMDAIRRILEGI